jgi:superfamily II DNA/RNA helicase
MPAKMRVLAKKILQHPIEINIAISKPPEQIIQKAFMVYEAQKVPVIIDMLSSNRYTKVIVFCSKKANVKQLASKLLHAKLAVAEIHSDLDQKSREQFLQDFRNQKTNILVSTDILSRGIDIDDIDLVINFDVPNDGEDYIHRIGRTARAATSGTAFTLVGEKEQSKFAEIEELLGAPVIKGIVPDMFGPTPTYAPRANNARKFTRKR